MQKEFPPVNFCAGTTSRVCAGCAALKLPISRKPCGNSVRDFFGVDLIRWLCSLPWILFDELKFFYFI
jgi:hypothetical protein